MNILLIALHYHDYPQAIADEFRALGHEVRVHDIQPRDLVMKALRVAAPRIWQKRLDRAHRAILDAERGKETELVLFIQAHQMRHELIVEFRRTFPAARFALYNWDSLSNHDYLDRASLFDTVQTFDPADAREHGFLYLPLFASRRFQNVPNRMTDPRSVYFVGNIVNPNRYRALDAFRAYCAAEDIDFSVYMACSPVVRSWLRREGIRATGLASGSIAVTEFDRMLQTSNAVFDFANHEQTGYTMRIFENLCAGKKIITNNERIAHEPFYSPDRVLVIDSQDYRPVKKFLGLPLANPTATFPAYQIQAFARHLLEGTGHPNSPAPA
jgi:hypothetical protein